MQYWGMSLISLFSFGKITTKVSTHSVRIKYLVWSPTKVVSNLIELLSSTVWRSFHALTAKKFHEELDINNVCALNIKARFSLSLYALIGKITTAALMHSFRVWYVQCLAKRPTLNLIEFIQWKVWRSFDSLAVKNFMKNLTTTTLAARLQDPTAFVSKLFSGKSNFRSRD